MAIVGRRSELIGPPTLSAKKVLPYLPFQKILLLRRKINQNQRKKAKRAKNCKKKYLK
jgi:hypothetical protein